MIKHEAQQLLIPNGAGGYEVLDLTGMLLTESGIATPPKHFITQRGPFQHGETLIGMRLDPRPVQFTLAYDALSEADYHELRRKLLQALASVNTLNAFGVGTPCVYRRINNATRRVWRSDMLTTSGSVRITSATARFCEWGIVAGSAIIIESGADAGTHYVATVYNENTLDLTAALTATATDVLYHSTTGRIIRDLDVYVDLAPQYARDLTMETVATKDAIRLLAPDPVWRNPFIQIAQWGIVFRENLVFYESPDWTDRAVFPITFSTDEIFAVRSLTYLGTWPARPTLLLHGPFSQFIIKNLSTGNLLSMTYAAAPTEVITINLTTLSAYNGAGANLTNYLFGSGGLDSDLVTFNLSPKPIVVDGINTFEVTMYDSDVSASGVDMSWQAQYESV